MVASDTRALTEVEGHIVAATEANQFATLFHPELNTDTQVHEYFL